MKKGNGMKGYVQVYTGDGKGKTTAAIGLAVRAVGAGLKVFIGQFVKGMEYSELKALERFAPQLKVRQYGRKAFVHNTPTEEDFRLAREGYEDIRRAINSKQYELVILDEANIAVYFSLLTVEDLLALIDGKPDSVELVFTGRKADQRLLERADLVTEMTEVKHYYQKGIVARDGIEK
jgi:cob(I)alamin adenosyltransferase